MQRMTRRMMSTKQKRTHAHDSAVNVCNTCVKPYCSEQFGSTGTWSLRGGVAEEAHLFVLQRLKQAQALLPSQADLHIPVQDPGEEEAVDEEAEEEEPDDDAEVEGGRGGRWRSDYASSRAGCWDKVRRLDVWALNLGPYPSVLLWVGFEAWALVCYTVHTGYIRTPD